MRLTPSEAECLRHRLEVSDCIAEAMTDRGEDEPPAEYTFDEIVDVADELLDMLPELPDVVTQLQAYILDDCCDGSTWLAVISDAFDNGEISKGQLLAAQKAAGSLERKISQLIGREVEVCRY